MKVTELKDKLISEGCNEQNFGILYRADDAYSIMKRNQKWVVFYSERGRDSDPVFTSSDEDEACDYFYRHILNQKHRHLVAFCQNENDTNEIENKLKGIGVNPIRNDIPSYSKENDPRYRIFVEGKDVFEVKKHFGYPQRLSKD